MQQVALSKEPQRQNTYLRTCACSEVSDLSAGSRSLIKILPGRILTRKGCTILSCGQRRLNAKVDLSLCLAHMSEGTFSDVRLHVKMFSDPIWGEHKRGLLDPETLFILFTEDKQK